MAPRRPAKKPAQPFNGPLYGERRKRTLKERLSHPKRTYNEIRQVLSAREAERLAEEIRKKNEKLIIGRAKRRAKGKK